MTLLLSTLIAELQENLTSGGDKRVELQADITLNGREYLMTLEIGGYASDTYSHIILLVGEQE